MFLYAARPATSSILVARRSASIRDVTARTLSMISSAVAVHTMGAQRLFQCSMNDSMLLLRAFTELNVPHRITFRPRIPFQISSGSPGALLRRGPLSTDYVDLYINGCMSSRWLC